MSFAPFAFAYVHISEATECNVTVYLCLFLEMLYVNKIFVLLVHKIFQYQVTYRTHGTVRKVRLVRIFITRTNVPYLSNNYVPYKRTVLFAEKWSVPYRTCVPYRTVLPSLLGACSFYASDGRPLIIAINLTNNATSLNQSPCFIVICLYE